MIVGSITAVSMVRHRQQVNEQKEAEQQKDAALAADRAKADEVAKQAAAQTEAAMTPVDPNAAPGAQGSQQPGQSPAGKTAAGNTALAAGATNSGSLTDKKSGAKIPATRGSAKPSALVTPATASNSAQAQQTPSQPPPQVQNPAPAPTTSTTPAAATTTNPSTPPNTGAAAPSAPPKQPDVVATADFAKLRIDDRTVPTGVSFTVMMDGKLFFQRSALADGQQDPKHDDDSIPPGTHQFHVITSQGGLQVSESNNVRFDFQAKKKLTLKIEVRDGSSGQMLKRNSKPDAGTSSFQISVKPTGLLGF